MFQYSVVLFVLFFCTVLSTSQEIPLALFNASENGRQVLNPLLDYDYPESNLWLISRDDPIPIKLNGQWSVDDAISRSQAGNLPRNDYGSRVSNPPLNENVPEKLSVLPQPPTSIISQARTVDYDRTVTIDNRRRRIDGRDETVSNTPDAVLVQLPADVTEGLWVRPQRFSQEPVINAGTSVSDDLNRESTDGINTNNGIPTVFLPIRESISRLPNIYREGKPNVPVGQYYEVPIPISTADGYDSRGIPSSTTDRTQSTGQDVWIIRQNENNPTSPINPTVERTDTPAAYPPDARGNHQEIETVLTAEDIDLLERLGILSSFFVEPTTRENTTKHFVRGEHLQREREDNPVLIDNGGQNYFINRESENLGNVSDVVLIDIPQFTAAEYHTDISENAGIHRDDNVRLSPYIFIQPQNSREVNTSIDNLQNYTNLSNLQIIEFLQSLGINTPANSFNLSHPDIAVSERQASERNENEKPLENGNIYFSQDDISQKTNISTNTETTKQNTLTGNTSSTSETNSETRNSNFVYKNVKPSAQASVSNGRIQPRLLEKPPMRENEVIGRLIEKAIPISERKLEILKKLQVNPQPYFFGFKQNDGNGTLQHRNETSDAKGVVKGTYGYRDSMGVYRNVSYIADKNGFHAVVKTNEPGTVSHNTADVVFMSETPPLAALLKMLAYKKSKLATNITDNL